MITGQECGVQSILGIQDSGLVNVHWNTRLHYFSAVVKLGFVPIPTVLVIDTSHWT